MRLMGAALPCLFLATLLVPVSAHHGDIQDCGQGGDAGLGPAGSQVISSWRCDGSVGGEGDFGDTYEIDWDFGLNGPVFVKVCYWQLGTDPRDESVTTYLYNVFAGQATYEQGDDEIADEECSTKTASKAFGTYYVDIRHNEAHGLFQHYTVTVDPLYECSGC